MSGHDDMKGLKNYPSIHSVVENWQVRGIHTRYQMLLKNFEQNIGAILHTEYEFVRMLSEQEQNQGNITSSPVSDTFVDG